MSARGSATQHALAVITILAITGTLYGCGRYGSPVRAVPDPVAVGIEVEVEAEAEASEGSSDRRAGERRAESDR
ncbi:MAG: hypothetical protein VCB25_04665 [Myxococcota bacterium]